MGGRKRERDTTRKWSESERVREREREREREGCLLNAPNKAKEFSERLSACMLRESVFVCLSLNEGKGICVCERERGRGKERSFGGALCFFFFQESSG